MTWTIDRFEGDVVVCELPDGSFAGLPRSLLPKEVREGDVLRRAPDGAFYCDTAETAARRQKNAARLRRLAGR